MGLGEAVERLLNLEFMRRNGLHNLPEQAREERDMILNALNAQTLDLGFDCDNDGEIDSVNDVSIFERSVSTSCCRLALNVKPQKTKRTQSRLRKMERRG